MTRLVTVVLVAVVLFFAIAVIGPSKSEGIGTYVEQNATLRSWSVSIRDAVRGSPAGDKLVAMGFLENGPQAAAKAPSAKPAGR